MKSQTKSFDVVVPVHKEPISDIKESLDKIYEHLCDLSQQLRFSYNLTVACSNSPGRTQQSLQRYIRNHDNMRLVQESEPGRGRVLKNAWNSSDCDFVMYMDVDISTDLDSLNDLLKPLLKNYNGIVIGDRTNPKSKVSRKWHRKIASSIYSFATQKILRTKHADMQCGFKALPTKLAKKLIPDIKNNDWLFDSEMLILAEEQGIKIKSIPVFWKESSPTSVKTISTALETLSFINRVMVRRKYLINIDRLVQLSLIILSGIVYCIHLTNNKFANVYYSTATQSAVSSWKAFFFGSFDLNNFITIDKFPLIIWPSALLAKIFGFSQATILLPYALAGIASCLLLYKIIKKYFGILSGIIASLVFISLPLGSIMFRFNNPDVYLVLASLVLLYCLQKALEKSSYRWFVLTGITLGIMFQIKTLQALIFLPVVIIVMLWQNKAQKIISLGKKSIITLGCFFVTSLWWPIVVSLIPKTNRPLIGGSQTNNVWDLILGYNGLSRLTGSGSAHVTGGTSAVFGGESGIFRLLNASFFTSIGWYLLPLLTIAGFSLYMSFKRTSALTINQHRLLMFWSLVLSFHVIIFSFAKGKIHAYYSLILLPTISALIALSLYFVRYYRKYSSNLFFWASLSSSISLIIVSGALKVINQQWNPKLITPLLIVGFLLICCTIILKLKWRPYQTRYIYVMGLLIIFGFSLLSTINTWRTSYVGYVPTPIPKDAVFSSIPPIPLVNEKLFKVLNDNTKSNKWIGVTENSFDASVIQLATGRPALPLGGFDGNKSLIDDETLSNYVKSGEIKYFVSSQPLSPSTYRPIHQWVTKNMTQCESNEQWQVYATNTTLCKQLSKTIN